MISYAWRDNQPPPMTKQEGWVSAFQSGLEYWLKQILPRPPKVWRDKNQMPGNKLFADELDQVVGDCAILLTVISEPYLSSEWCARELDNFVKAAEHQGGLQVDNNYRIFKINKFPVDRNALPDRLTVVTGFDFFEQDPDTRVIAPIDPTFGDAQKQLFIRKVYDVAVALVHLLNDIESKGLKPETDLPAKVAEAAAVATQPEPADDRERQIFILHEENDKELVRDLRKGFRALPAGGPPVNLILPLFEGDAEAQKAVKLQRLRECDAVILFWGSGNAAWMQSQIDEVKQCLKQSQSDPAKVSLLVYIAGEKTTAKEDWAMDFEDGLLDPSVQVIEGFHEVPHAKLDQFVRSVK